MKFTRKQVRTRINYVQELYRAGRLTAREIAQYESLPGWTWHKRTKSPEEWVSVAEQLATQHHNILPNVPWLRSHGYAGLVAALAKFPQLFLHIRRDKAFKLVSEWVDAAEKLAAQHRGVLPNKGWLTHNCHFALLQSMAKHPDAFEHIAQDKKHKTLLEWVSIAETLAKTHKGTLPSRSWMKKHHHRGLQNRMHKHPRAFRHIKQLKLDRQGRVIS